MELMRSMFFVLGQILFWLAFAGGCYLAARIVWRSFRRRRGN